MTLYRCFWSPGSLQILNWASGGIFFAVPSLTQCVFRCASPPVQKFHTSGPVLAWNGAASSFIGLWPACAKKTGGSLLFSLLYFTVLSPSALSVHTWILLRSPSEFLLWGVPELHCIVRYSWWYLPVQQIFALHCTRRELFQHWAAGGAATPVHELPCIVGMKDGITCPINCGDYYNSRCFCSLAVFREC